MGGKIIRSAPKFQNNPQGGGVFFHHFQLRLAEKKTPPLSLLLSKIKKIEGFQIKAK